MKPLKSMSEEWFEAICWSWCVKIKCVAFILIVLGSLKWDCDIKTSEILSFLSRKDNPVTLNIYC